MARKTTEPKEYATAGAEPAPAAAIAVQQHEERRILHIARADIVESETNPRQHWNIEALDELAENIREVGILSPILVRPIRNDDGDIYLYEIVFGHRRYRAAQRAGLQVLPCEVRELTDSEARRLQHVENLQREDLDPIDEADGYVAYIAATGISAQQLADEIKKSRTRVYDYIKLAQLCHDGRELVRDGVLDPNTALLAARLATPELQTRALREIVQRIPLESGGHEYAVMSYRRARTHIDEVYSRQLQDAHFDRADFALLPDTPACGECPHRLGNLEAETKGKRADICTKPECYDAKAAAHVRNIAATALATGGEVIEGGDARRLLPSWIAPGELAYSNSRDLMPLDQPNEELEGKSPAEALGKKLKPADIVHIVHPDTGAVVKAVRSEVLAKHKLIEPEPTPEEMAARKAEVHAQYEARDRERTISDAIRRRRCELLLALINGVPRQPADLRFLAWTLFEVVDPERPEELEWFRQHHPDLHARLPVAKEWGMTHDQARQRDELVFAWIDTLDNDQLAQAVLAFALMREAAAHESDTSIDPLTPLAVAYGVDSEKIARDVEAELTQAEEPA